MLLSSRLLKQLTQVLHASTVAGVEYNDLGICTNA